MAGDRTTGVKGTAVKYANNNPYRTESLTVTPKEMKKDGGQTTAANGGKFYSESEVDSINIDYQAEIRVKSMFTTDWDLNMGAASTLSNFSEYSHTNNGIWGIGDGDDKRILFTVDFNESFKSRDTSKQADVLWTRIESDPIKRPYDGADVNVFNSVRQNTLNFNSDNSIVEGSGENQHYKYRPYVIFYTGPENIDYATNDKGVLIRHSQPVVVNLNEDTNAIMYFPESPVVLNGNGHKLTGFIIAKCFLFAVTSEDMTNKKTFELYDGFNAPKDFKGNFSEYTVKYADGSKHITYFHNDDHFFTREELDEEYSDARIINDETTGNLTVKENIPVPQYLLLDYSKEDNKTYEVKNENGMHDEKATFAYYVNSTYKEKFKAFSGLNDSQISAVSFPNENYNFTGATYWVATADLSETKTTDTNCVKVIVDGEEKFVDKRKLPYVKVRTNKSYFYVCVYDLKTAWSGGTVDYASNSGVRMIDGSFTDKQINASYGTVVNKGIKTNNNEYKNVDDRATVSDADIYINPNDTWCDSWGISGRNNGLIKIYMDNWKKDMLEFVTKDSYTYFIFNSDSKVIAKYRKFVIVDDDDNETIKYIRDDNDNIQYYTKVDNNKDKNGKVINYIIVDRNGNMLTKTLTPADVLTADTKSVNETMEDDFKKIPGQSPKTPQGTYSSSPDVLRAYWNDYTRAPNDKELPGDVPRDPTNAAGEYRGSAQARKYKDYRIPALERVYYKSVFNLDESSCYSFFEIPELKRVNYLYLNVDELNYTADKKPSADMFFTTKRAN